ncbi:13692_t:CDS:2 [Cetraspora pellucida]|uniref:13692_t:CDS:1 n=1 Tax=Cetraspora pellucida TaxID=1433469 RepID=A0A9N9AK24_9GLOM|nr:13692_t:CDS:2 [Cetraspora pellucida]
MLDVKSSNHLAALSKISENQLNHLKSKVEKLFSFEATSPEVSDIEKLPIAILYGEERISELSRKKLLGIHIRNLADEKEIITNNATIKPYLNYLPFVNVSNSLVKLNSDFQELTSLAKQYNAKEFIDNAKKLNPIIVDVSKTTEEVAFDSHNPSTSESRAINVELLGGSGLTYRSGYKCTAAFWVNFGGLKYLVTAGNCGINGPTSRHRVIDFYYSPFWEHDSILPENLIGPMMSMELIEDSS